MASSEELEAYTRKCLAKEPTGTGLSIHKQSVLRWPPLTKELTEAELALVPLAVGGVTQHVEAFNEVLEGKPFADAGLTDAQTSEYLTHMLYMVWMDRFNRYDKTDILRGLIKPRGDSNFAVFPLHLGRFALAAGPSMDAWKVSDVVAVKYAFLSNWPPPSSDYHGYWSTSFLQQLTRRHPMGGMATSLTIKWGPPERRPAGASNQPAGASNQPRAERPAEARETMPSSWDWPPQLFGPVAQQAAGRAAEARATMGDWPDSPPKSFRPEVLRRLAAAGVLVGLGLGLTVAGTAAVAASRRRKNGSARAQAAAAGPRHSVGRSQMRLRAASSLSSGSR